MEKTARNRCSGESVIQFNESKRNKIVHGTEAKGSTGFECID